MQMDAVDSLVQHNQGKGDGLQMLCKEYRQKHCCALVS
jgi:hypothetical protein